MDLGREYIVLQTQHECRGFGSTNSKKCREQSHLMSLSKAGNNFIAGVRFLLNETGHLRPGKPTHQQSGGVDSSLGALCYSQLSLFAKFSPPGRHFTEEI